jgi:integrase
LDVASIIERDGRWRALVRKAGYKHCETFPTRTAAKAWAARIEGEIDELTASGVVQPKGLTLADLIDRYILELYSRKPWGRTKSADLARLKKDLGHLPAGRLRSAHFTNHFRKRHAEGAGAVVINSQMCYLVGVLKVARTVFHLDVALQAAQDARTALSSLRMVGKSGRRDRRVTNVELDQLIKYFEKQKTAIPMADILKFCLASGMRISEVCRLEWRHFNAPAKLIVICDRKHPQDKLGNDQTVPLLDATGHDAYAILKRQPKNGPRIFPFNSRTISTYVTRATEEIGLPDLHLHDLRHEAISRLFEAGYRIEQVALVSGHRDWQMLRRYTHVRAADLHRTPLLS